jgi:hypothetical protein
MLTFPTALFAPTSMIADLVGASVAGQRSLSGITQSALFSGGPFWVFEFGEAVLWDRAKFNTWRAIAAQSDSGATPFIVPVCDRKHQPFIDPKRPAGVGNGDDSVFSDGATWAGEYIEASIDGTAALRATQLAINIAGGRDLIGGEFFTIWHLTKGQRMYEVTRILSQGGGSAVINIRPGLREATAADIPLDFDNPRCTMGVAGGMAAILEMLKRGKSPTIRFVESFAPVDDPIPA